MKKIFLLGGTAASLVHFRGALISALVARGHQVVACAPDASAEIIEEIQHLGAQYQNISLERTGVRPMHDLTTVVDLLHALRQHRPDYFLGYTVKPIIYGSIAARLARVKKIFSIVEGLGFLFANSREKNGLLIALAKQLYRVALSFSQKIFFLNPDDINDMYAAGVLTDRNKAVLLNGIGVDLQHYTPCAYPMEISFLMIARLLRDKGVSEYAEAARLLRYRYPAVKFRLVGRIDTNPSAISPTQLAEWIRAGNIEHLGLMQDVRPAICNCSVYVLPSYREGLPVTIMEAMAMGRPVITTDVPGCRETVVNERNGYLVEKGQAVALARAMEIFVKHPGDIARMGQESRKIAVSKFNVHVTNEQIITAMGLG